MTAANPLDTLERHRLELDRLTALLSTVINYLEADLETSHLEGLQLDANTRELGELSGRVAELERRIDNAARRDELERVTDRLGELTRRGDNHLAYLDSLQATTDRLAERAGALENESHSRRVS